MPKETWLNVLVFLPFLTLVILKMRKDLRVWGETGNIHFFRYSLEMLFSINCACVCVCVNDGGDA